MGKILICIFSVCVVYRSKCQSAVYDFLNLTASAYHAGLGGKSIALLNDDVDFAIENPALLNGNMTRKVNFGYVNYFADVNYGQVSSAFQIDGFGLFTTSAKYVHYGDIIKSKNGEVDGVFSAQDIAVSVGYVYTVFTGFNIGINLKFISSGLYTYTSYGVATDIGIRYHNTAHNITTTLLVKNLGFQIKPYHQNRENLPFEILLGLGKTLENAPVTFTLTMGNLQKFNTLYEGDHKKSFGQKLLSHFTVGADFFADNIISFRVGYNFKKAHEMHVSYKKALNGLSFGLQVRLSLFRLSYGQSIYHVRGGTQQFTLMLDLEELF